jgi:predicted RNA-binding protein (virulence factor B family)
MIKIGEFNRLQVVKEVSFGLYLNGDEWGEILLPRKVVPKDTQPYDLIDVFIYFDSEDKIIATTVKPRVMVGEFACLKVIDVNRVGAFLDWGLDKDLLVPRAEQKRPMEKDKFYIVYALRDNRERILASSKIDHYLDKSPIPYHSGDEVNLIVAERTELGTKVIINERHWGLVHSEEIFTTLRYGNRILGYIKNVRNDGKIDVVLRKIGRDGTNDLAQRILFELEKQGGFLPLHDKSSPLEIQRVLGESKRNFKNAIGNLYKRGEIVIEETGIRSYKKIGT